MIKSCYVSFLLFALLAGVPFRINATSYEVDGIYYTITDGTNKKVSVTRPDSDNPYSGAIVIPSKVKIYLISAYYTYTVTGIEPLAFSASYGSSVTSVTIPSSMTSIGEQAFTGCEDLESVDIPSSVTRIGSRAFEGCTALESIEIPEGVTHIGDYIFYGCSNLKNIELPSTLTGIGSSTFNGCTSLEDVTIPSAVTYIGDRAFEGCSVLSSIEITDGVTSIGNYAFRNCTALSSVTLSEDLKAIGKYAFESCANLKSVVIPENVTSMEYGSFADCFLDTLVILSRSVSSYDGCLDEASIEATYAYASQHDSIAVHYDGDLYSILPKSIEITDIYLAGIKISLQDCEESYLGTIANFSSLLVNEESVTVNSDGTCFVSDLPIVSSSTTRTISLTYTANGKEYTDEVEFVQTGLKDLVSMSCAAKTQTTATITVELPEDDETANLSDVTVYGYSSSSTVTIEDGVATIIITGLTPGTEYSFPVRLWYDEQYYSVGSVSMTTASVYFTLRNEDLTPTSACCDYVYSLGDAEVKSVDIYSSSITKTTSENGLHLEWDGLVPQTSYSVTIYFYLTTGKSSIKKTWSFKTSAVSLSTQEPYVVSSSMAIISATTNLADTVSTAGFEWRKYDAPDEVASKSAAAVIYEGELAGAIKNLSEDTYYKFRPYFIDAEGSVYYGDWVGFDTGDFSYFDPTVRTGDVEVSDSYVTVKGYALQGTEDIEDQGFEYWVSSSSAKSSRISSKASEDGVTRVTVDGQKMTATLTDLLSGITYEIRAYATTASGTTYGETVQFTTAEATGISNITASGSESLELLVRQSDGVSISVSGGEKNECNYRISSMTGGTMASGKVATDGNWYTVADANTQKGIYVITVTDGRETKAKKLLVK